MLPSGVVVDHHRRGERQGGDRRSGGTQPLSLRESEQDGDDEGTVVGLTLALSTCRVDGIP